MSTETASSQPGVGASSAASSPTLVEAARGANPEAKVVPIDPSGAIKGYAGGRPTGAPAASISWLLGIDLARLAEVTRAVEVMAYAASKKLITVWMVQHAGYPGDGNQAQGAFTKAAFESFGK